MKDLYKNGTFVIRVCTLYYPPLESEVDMYGIYNTATEVREAEARRFANAITICDYLGNPPKKEEEYDIPEQTELTLN